MFYATRAIRTVTFPQATCVRIRAKVIKCLWTCRDPNTDISSRASSPEDMIRKWPTQIMRHTFGIRTKIVCIVFGE
ncbi:hypothetical protein TNCT_724861 [Trichonephila clavata]|uniref:Uncharacterized protein n=1 Tax=Trichonephila clavata TaxID=2740835 RepID=A0A8X6I1U5_TRICU|nr:hypothetical protein TNCT_724861 [Trichonephila clavata]